MAGKELARGETPTGDQNQTKNAPVQTTEGTNPNTQMETAGTPKATSYSDATKTTATPSTTKTAEERLANYAERVARGRNLRFTLLSRSTPGDIHKGKQHEGAKGYEVRAKIYNEIIGVTTAALKRAGLGNDTYHLPAHLEWLPADNKEVRQAMREKKLTDRLPRYMLRFRCDDERVLKVIEPILRNYKHSGMDFSFKRLDADNPPPQTHTHTATVYDVPSITVRAEEVAEYLNSQGHPDFQIIKAVWVGQEAHELRRKSDGSGLAPSAPTALTVTLKGKAPASLEEARTAIEIAPNVMATVVVHSKHLAALRAAKKRPAQDTDTEAENKQANAITPPGRQNAKTTVEPEKQTGHTQGQEKPKPQPKQAKRQTTQTDTHQTPLSQSPGTAQATQENRARTDTETSTTPPPPRAPVSQQPQQETPPTATAQQVVTDTETTTTTTKTTTELATPATKRGRQQRSPEPTPEQGPKQKVRCDDGDREHDSESGSVSEEDEFMYDSDQNVEAAAKNGFTTVTNKKQNKKKATAPASTTLVTAPESQVRVSARKESVQAIRPKGDSPGNILDNRYILLSQEEKQ